MELEPATPAGVPGADRASEKRLGDDQAKSDQNKGEHHEADHREQRCNRWRRPGPETFADPGAPASHVLECGDLTHIGVML